MKDMSMNIGAIKEKLSDMLSFQKANSVIGLDIGTSFIKVVQLRRDGERAVLETYGELALGPYGGLDIGRATSLPVEKIIQAVTDLLQEANVTANVGSVAIPLGSTLLSLIEMPLMEERQLESAIPLEARKYIPVPIAEVALDYWILPKEEKSSRVRSGEEDGKDLKKKKNTIEVLVVAIHNEVLEKYNTIINKTNLQKSSLEIEVFSAVRSTLSHDMSPLMVLDMGAATTKLAMVEHGIIHTSHIINKGSQDITIALSQSLNTSVMKAERLKREVGLTGEGENAEVSKVIDATSNFILSEANRVLLNYQMKYNKTITKVILTGGGVLLKGFVEEAGEKLASEVVYGDAFSKVQTPAFLDPVLKEAGPEFAVALGLALRKLQETG